MSRSRERTAYEEDEALFRDLHDQAYMRPGAALYSHSVPVRRDPAVVAEEKRLADAAQKRAEVKAAEKKRREAQVEAERNALILVYCTACGKAHTGTRIELAKFRKCCSASGAERKFCRACGKVVTREEYFSMTSPSVKGWGTFAKCYACGTQHRKAIRPCRVCGLTHEVMEDGHE